MNNIILEKEKSLFKLEYMKNNKYLNEVIDDNYLEIGKSGKFISKAQVIEDLTKQAKNREITIYNYKCNKIDNNTWVIHYITKNNEEKIYRTSIWQENDNLLRIIFHQASKLTEEIKLIEY